MHKFQMRGNEGDATTLFSKVLSDRMRTGNSIQMQENVFFFVTGRVVKHWNGVAESFFVAPEHGKCAARQQSTSC